MPVSLTRGWYSYMEIAVRTRTAYSRTKSRDTTEIIYLTDGEWCDVFNRVDILKAIRKDCVQQREYWLTLKKQTQGPAARHAKLEAILWLQRERAVTILINATETNTDTYSWPLELLPAFSYCTQQLCVQLN